ncbi:MAG: cyclase family protein [Planctomycetes bacterium]|jgi:kynurenine formamidase|nr:cyclase family protein [Planctomycetota bacterium]
MSRIIDLTLPLHSAMRGVSFEPARTLEKDGWNATTLHLYSHCGTHMDAPTHFAVSDQTIDRIPLDRCMGPAWVVDPVCRVPVRAYPDNASEDKVLRRHYERALIGVADLGPAADKIQKDDSLLLRTGWSRYVDEPCYRDELPRVSLELARWCAAKKIRMLGVEPPSVADVNNREELTAVHKVLLEAGVIIVEGLANLDQIRRAKVSFMAFPLKIAGGDGAPVRALALED